MLPTPEQISFLNRLLSVLAGDYQAAVKDDTLPQNVIVLSGPLGNDHRLECGITIDPSEDQDGTWTVNAAVTVYGNRECPDDVELVELKGPCSWELACVALVQELFKSNLDTVLVNIGEARLADELEQAGLSFDEWLLDLEEKDTMDF